MAWGRRNPAAKLTKRKEKQLGKWGRPGMARQSRQSSVVPLSWDLSVRIDKDTKVRKKHAGRTTKNGNGLNGGKERRKRKSEDRKRENGLASVPTSPRDISLLWNVGEFSRRSSVSVRVSLVSPCLFFRATLDPLVVLWAVLLALPVSGVCEECYLLLHLSLIYYALFPVNFLFCF